MSLYNDDELEAPAWINQEFLQKVLKNVENSNAGVEILKFDLSPASMKGDHYASIMFRCQVNYRIENTGTVLKKSFIIKTIPVEEGLKREMLIESKLFDTEIEMYTKTLPKIEKILEACGEPTRLSAEIFYYSLEPHKVIVLEDLCESGFDTVRGRFLSEEEIKGVYRKIVKLHAVSHMLGHSEDHECVTKYQAGYFNSSITAIDDLVKNGLQNFQEMLSSYGEFQVCLEKFNAMQGIIHQACKDLYNAYTLSNEKTDVFVLNHEFLRILKKIKYQGELPKYSDFKNTAVKYRHFTVFMVAALLPVVIGVFGKTMEELAEMDTTKFVESPEMIGTTYHIPAYIEHLRQLLPILLKEGYFD